MGKMVRNPADAAKVDYDLIIIGGGIYGAFIAFEASKRRLNSLLLERSDFGGATTFNCLRTLHGGFRYLQTLNLQRFFESVGERHWFQRAFPDLVEPLSFLMPLYGKGVRRPSVLRIAALLNDALSYKRNDGVLPEKHLPASKVINVEQTRKNFPLVDLHGLQGGVIWYDVCMSDSQLILMEILRLAHEKGSTALNYMEAHQLMKIKEGVTSVVATDLENGQTHEYKTRVVVNAGGPWCRDIARRFDSDKPDLFKSSLAWNMLLNRDALSTCALAITPKKPHAHTYFLLPWKGKLLAGTGHKPWRGSVNNVTPSAEMIQEFIDDLNYAIPSLKLSQEDILYLFQGLLPAVQDGSTILADHEVILNHVNVGGPRGLYSISGVKFTTARLVAEKTLKLIFPERQVENVASDKTFDSLDNKSNNYKICDFNWFPSQNEDKWKEAMRSIIQEESVQHLDDLIFRRTTLWDNPTRALEIAPILCQLFKWDDNYCHIEMERLRRIIECSRPIGIKLKERL
jgi:glycerol-3-phosphate dehydrogenase